MIWTIITTRQQIDESKLPQSVPMSELTGEALWRSWGYEPLTPEIQAIWDAQDKKIADDEVARQEAIRLAQERLARVTEWINLTTKERRLTKDMPTQLPEPPAQPNSFNCKSEQWVQYNWREVPELIAAAQAKLAGLGI